MAEEISYLIQQGENIRNVTATEREFEIPLLRMAQILHEHGEEMSTNVAKAHTKVLAEYAKLGEKDKVVGVYDHERMSHVNDDLTRYSNERPGESRTGITLFLEPQTKDQNTYTQYPRVQFYYSGNSSNPDSLELTGYQVGVRGHMVGPRFILNKAAIKGGVSADLVDTQLNLDDVLRILEPYVTKKEEPLKLTIG